MSAEACYSAPAQCQLDGLERILRALMEATGAARCTLRIDHPAAGLSVNMPCGELLAPGMVSMMANGRVDHRRARSIRWIAATRRILVQEDVFADPALAPPPALSEVFGTRAQIVAPLFGLDEYLFGWLSAHFAEGPRHFSQADMAAVQRARDAALSLPGLPLEPSR